MFLSKSAKVWVLFGGFTYSSVNFANVDSNDLYHMELEQLMDLPVSSVNKRASSLAESAAAVYVITNEAIRRSGEVSLPDVLALAPGVDVVKTNTSTWGVGVRGFNGQYSNKLLVLVDGRSVYSVIAGSVFWDVTMPLLDDIERIEVIRGPGASLWGSNAVNGVINVITKSAENTQGQHIVLGVGNEDKSYRRLRTGGDLGGIKYRLYGQTLDRDGGVNDHTGEDAEDGYQALQLGGRVDLQVSSRRDLSMQGEWYRLDKEYNPLIDELIADDAPTDGFEEDITGGHVLVHWSDRLSGTQQYDIQLSADKMHRQESIFTLEVVNVDVDFQHLFTLTDSQQITWGGNYRYSHDDFEGHYFVSIEDESRRYDRFTAFVQDEISLTDSWAVIAGIKFEETEFAPFDTQPTLRVLWTPNDKLTGWAAVSKANRTPNRVGKGVQLRFGSSEEYPSTERYVFGDEEFEAETLIAYETGVRSQLTSSVFVDVSGFYFEYDNLRTFDIEADYSVTPPYPVLNFIYANKARGYSFGGEAVVEWKPLKKLSFNLQYSYFDFVSSPDRDVQSGAGVIVFEEQEVHNIAALRCQYTFDGGIEFDWALKYRDGMDKDNIDPQRDIDVRLAWRYSPQIALSLIGKNLGGSKRLEFTDTLMAPDWTRIEPSAALQVDLHF